jgi:XTP/dITP diphosphohydrolase
MQLIFATNNLHKVQEIRLAVPPSFTVIPLQEAGIEKDIPEPFDTLEENAREKAMTIYQLTGSGCFSEDTGLEVYALGNEPGVHSARYAGPNRSATDNIALLLERLKGIKDRKARFRTVICLILEGKEHYFEGICQGYITEKPRGEAGFGYDPVFIPDGSEKTFAEMRPEEKNIFSHRKKAADMLVTFLNNIRINREY